MISQSIILFCWHTFQRTTRYNAAWNKCTTSFKSRQLGGHFSLFPPHSVKIFQEDFQGHEFGSASVCLSLHLPNLDIICSLFQGQQSIRIYLKGMMCTGVNMERRNSYLIFFLCQQADSVSLSRNILAFLQRTPIPPLLVGSEKSKRGTSEEYQRGGA